MTEKILEIKFDEFIPEIVKGLNRKEDAWVYKKLIKLFIEDFSDLEDYDEIFEVIAINPNTPLELLHILKKYEDEDVREAVVLNPNTPISLLREMSKDTSPHVRMALLKRNVVELEFLELLAYDDGEDREELGLFDAEIDEYLRNYDENEEEEKIKTLQAVIGNLEEFENELYDEDDFEDDFDGDEDYDYDYDYDDFDILTEMRVLIATNTKTPAKILKKLSKDEDEDVRIAVAKNKKTSFAVLQKLSQDKDEFVRAAILLTEKKNIKIKLYIDKHSEWINR